MLRYRGARILLRELLRGVGISAVFRRKYFRRWCEETCREGAEKGCRDALGGCMNGALARIDMANQRRKAAFSATAGT